LYDISFNPFIQDLCAIAIIIENGAIELVKEKKYIEAIKKLSKIWASFPHENSNKSFYKNQKSQNLNFVKKICEMTKKDLETFSEKISSSLKKSEEVIGKVFNDIKKKIKFV